MEHTLLVLILIWAVLCSVFSVPMKWDDEGDDDGKYEDSLPGLVSPLDSWEMINSLLKSAEEPKDVAAPCCFPTKWQGNIDSQAGFSDGRKSKLIRSCDRMYVDVAGKRVAGTKYAGPKGNISFIVLFGANNTADLYGFNVTAKKCVHKKLPHAVLRAQCIPPNATFGGASSLGPKVGGLQVQTWFFRGHSPSASKGPKVGIAGKILVQGARCIPVMVQDFGRIEKPRGSDNVVSFDQSSADSSSEEVENDDKPKPKRRGGVGFVASAYFSNMELTISDPSVFTPPSYCPKTEDETDSIIFDDEQMPIVLERFISFE